MEKQELSAIGFHEESRVSVVNTDLRSRFLQTKSFGGRNLAENIEIAEQRIAKICDHLDPFYGRSHTPDRWFNIVMDEHATPASRMRQISAEIKKIKGALIENRKRIADQFLESEKLERRLQTNTHNKLYLKSLQIEAAHMASQLEESTRYYEGALKSVAELNNAYEMAKKQFVEENGHEFTEHDVQEDEARGHIMQGFRLAVRDIRATGRIGLGAQGYLEQFGVNITMALKDCNVYLKEESELAEIDGLFDVVKSEAKTLRDIRKSYDEEIEEVKKIEEAERSGIVIKDYSKDPRNHPQAVANYLSDRMRPFLDNVNRLDFLKKKHRGKVKNRAVSGVLLHDFVEKMGKKYLPAAALKKERFGLPTGIDKDSIFSSYTDGFERS